MFSRFTRNASGATAIEYGLIVAVLAMAIIGGMSQVGTSIAFMWGSNESNLSQALNTGDGGETPPQD
jgi:pilus assembly protein Flp/PilA